MCGGSLRVDNALFTAIKSLTRSSRCTHTPPDIFGFENFQTNSFEQLLINYANESLQQFFVKHIFKLEQEEYNSESINWQHISFVDNQAALDLIAVKTLNIMALIDEESKFPKGTDLTLLNKLHSTHERNPNYLCDPRTININTTFCINHFAGPVCYETRGFLEKNRDTFSADLVQMISCSKNKFLNKLFVNDINMGQETRKRALTLSAQFKKSLESLMKQLEDCHPYFIRCIKPNEFKKPMQFDRELCCKQLRYSGMMETIRIRRAGYPIRHTFYEFVERYRFLIAGIEPAHRQEDCKGATRRICKEVLKNADYQLGNTKVFLKDAHDLYLEQERDKILTKRIVTLQKYIRGWYYRKRFVAKRKAAVVLQKHWRVYLAKRNYLIMKNGFLRLQALIQSRALTNQFKHLRRHLVSLQSLCRGYLLRRELKVKSYAAVAIQRTIRGFIARKRFARLKQEYIRMKEIEAERELEEASLARKINANEAKKLAQMNYKERVKQLENMQLQEQLEDKALIAKKNALIDRAVELLDNKENEEAEDDSKLVDEMFDFLPPNDSQTNTIGRSGLVSNGLVNGMNNKAPTAFKDLENDKQTMIDESADQTHQFIDEDLDLSSSENEDQMYNKYLDPRTNLNNTLFGEEIEDLGLYKFQKFAATYFQGNANDKFSKKPLARSLLALPSQADSMAAIALSLTILRFMGDSPEPKFNSTLRDNTSVSAFSLNRNSSSNFPANLSALPR